MITFRQKNYVFGGYGRALLTGGIGGLLSALRARRLARECKEQGATDDQAIHYTKKKMRRNGALWGAIGGGIQGYFKGGLGGALLGAGVGAIGGGITGHLAGSKGARSSVNKYNEEQGEETHYSQNLYSYEEEDYLKKRKSQIKNIIRDRAIGGATSGALTGFVFAPKKNITPYVASGIVIGTGLGALNGINKKKEIKAELKRYKKGTKADQKYLRRRFLHETDDSHFGLPLI